MKFQKNKINKKNSRIFFLIHGLPQSFLNLDPMLFWLLNPMGQIKYFDKNRFIFPWVSFKL